MTTALNDNEIHSPSAWGRDLLAAGWLPITHTTWEDPEGRLWRGPYGAWCELQRRITTNTRGGEGE